MTTETHKKWLRFNISEQVRVRLTEEGRRRIIRNGHRVEEDAEGYSVWQLWVLFDALAGGLRCGAEPFKGCAVEMLADDVEGL